MVMAGFLKRLGWPFWLLGLVLGLLVPFLLGTIHSDSIIRDGLVYGVIYLVIAGVIGTLIKRRQANPAFLWLFPLFFLLGTWLVGPPDTISFALVYLCVSYLSYGFSHQ